MFLPQKSLHSKFKFPKFSYLSGRYLPSRNIPEIDSDFNCSCVITLSEVKPISILRTRALF